LGVSRSIELVLLGSDEHGAGVAAVEPPWSSWRDASRTPPQQQQRPVSDAGSRGAPAAEPQEAALAATVRDANRCLVRHVPQPPAADVVPRDDDGPAGDVSVACIGSSSRGDVSAADPVASPGPAAAEIAAYAAWNEVNERRPLRVADPQIEVWDLALSRAEVLNRMAAADAGQPLADDVSGGVGGGVVARETVELATVAARSDGSRAPPPPVPSSRYSCVPPEIFAESAAGAAATTQQQPPRPRGPRRAAMDMISAAVRAGVSYPRPSKTRPAVVVGTSWRHGPVEAAGKSLVIATATAQRVEAWRTPIEARVLHGVAESAHARRIVQQSLLGELQQSLRQRPRALHLVPPPQDRTAAIRMIAAQRRAQLAAEGASSLQAAVW
jgi:hypothetical protein